MKKFISYVQCPSCQLYTYQKIICTEVNKKHQIRRRRKCLDCNFRWYTIQNPEESIGQRKLASFDID